MSYLLTCNDEKKHQAKANAQSPTPAPVRCQVQPQSHPPTDTNSSLVLTEENHTPLLDTTMSLTAHASGDMRALFTPVEISLPIRTKKPNAGKEMSTNSEGGPATVGFDACTESYCVEAEAEADLRGLPSSVGVKCLVGGCGRVD